VLVDPDTGELVEVVEEVVLDLTPYDYRQAKAAVMRASLERREAEKAYRTAIREKAAAERAYRTVLSSEMLEAKVEHGATMAEAVAKGTQKVSEAKERAIIAEGMVYAALERLRLCTEDRQSLSQLIAWSRQVDASTYQEAGA
jgi:hypothetical protein